MAETPDVGSEAFLALSQFFVNESTFGDTLLRVAELACSMAGADMAGVTMLVEGRPRTGVFTDPRAPLIDQAQYETEDGPCLDAFRQQRIFLIESTLEDKRWPQFASDAVAHGILSTLSVPIAARSESLGALNLYSKRLSAFDEVGVQRAGSFATHAAFVLVNAQVYWDAFQLNQNLNQALTSRATIDYAVGILIAHGGRNPEEAFQVLVRASQRENRKLRDVAADMVERAAQRLGPEALD